MKVLQAPPPLGLDLSLLEPTPAPLGPSRRSSHSSLPDTRLMPEGDLLLFDNEGDTGPRMSGRKPGIFTLSEFEPLHDADPFASAQLEALDTGRELSTILGGLPASQNPGQGPTHFTAPNEADSFLSSGSLAEAFRDLAQEPATEPPLRHGSTESGSTVPAPIATYRGHRAHVEATVWERESIYGAPAEYRSVDEGDVGHDGSTLCIPASDANRHGSTMESKFTSMGFSLESVQMARERNVKEDDVSALLQPFERDRQRKTKGWGE